MKQCRFCLENIHESAEACSHCGNWQPSPETVQIAYSVVAERMARNRMGSKRALFLLWIPLGTLGSALIAISSSFDSPIVFIVSSLFLLLSFILPFFIKHNLFQQYLYKIVFENAVELDRLLHQELRQWQISKPRSYTRTLVILGIFITLVISNPTKQEFIDFYVAKTKVERITSEKPLAEDEVIVRRINFILCSIYPISKKDIYVGVLGNFPFDLNAFFEWLKQAIKTEKPVSP